MNGIDISDDIIYLIFYKAPSGLLITKLIIDNINRLKSCRSEYEKYIINNRDNKINDILN